MGKASRILARQFTLDQLLRMSSGLQIRREHVRSAGGCHSHAVRRRRHGRLRTAGKRLESMQGTAWRSLERTAQRPGAGDAQRARRRWPILDIPSSCSVRAARDDRRCDGDRHGGHVRRLLVHVCDARDWARLDATCRMACGTVTASCRKDRVAYARSAAPADSRRHYGAHL